MSKPPSYQPITALIHHPYVAPEGFVAVQPAIYKASTVIFPDVSAMHQRTWRVPGNHYSYGLHGTPTTFTLQERLATLEGGTHALLAPSGLSAIGLVNLALLNQGDDVLIPQNVYGPNLDMVDQVLGRLGVTHQVYDPMQPNLLPALITPKTRLIWLEAAGSVTMEFPDIIALLKIARAHQLIAALDNTWGAGLAFNPFELPEGLAVDISVHALTKYPSGGADILMGSIVTRDEALHQQLKYTQQYLGINVAANDAEIVLRSLPSMKVRYTAQDQAARALATWLATRPEIAQVLHPALPDSPGHAAWQAICTTEDVPQGLAAGLFTITFKSEYSDADVQRFCERLKLFKLGYSWGGPMSLVVPLRFQSLRGSKHGPTPHLVQGGMVRFSIGLEDVRDLKVDIEHAFSGL